MTHLNMWFHLGWGMAEHWPGSCGPGCLGKVFPDGPFKTVCKFHDFAYLVGGTKEDFKTVERAFRTWLLEEAHRADYPWLWVFVAYTYSAFTRVWGWHLRRWRRADKPMTWRQLRATQEYKDAQSRLQDSRR